MGAADSAAGAVLVRVAEPADQPGVAALLASAGRRPEDAPRPPGRCVAVAAGPPEFVIGYGAWWQVRPGKFRMELLVAPRWRGKGVGSGLLGCVAGRARAAGAATLQARADVGQARSLGFLLARGFVETMRMHRQVLQVADARLSAHEDRVARLAGRGIVIASLDQELARRTGCWREYCRVFNAAREGWPDPDPGPGPAAPLAPPEFRRRYRAAEVEHRVGAAESFLAVADDRYVGFTGALGTAVDPAFRGQGIATALKLRAVVSARDHGLVTLHTSTGNPAMLRINQQLGFRLVSTEIRLVRTFEAIGSADADRRASPEIAPSGPGK
jgi:GNAT superfamily N-acetyltransferase